MKSSTALLRTCIPAAALLILLIIHGIPFLQGFRLTADDVNYHLAVMKGIKNASAFVFNMAIEQGRVVHLIDVPFTLFGSNYADYPNFRIFYTSLFFSNYILFSIYISDLLKIKNPHLLAVLLASITPLDYFHLPPNAYPFHASLPIFLILASRLFITHLKNTPHQNITKFVPLYAIYLFGMLFSELAFIFGSCLAIMEFTIRYIDRLPKTGPEQTTSLLFIDRTAIADSFVIATFLALYTAFRIYFPSNYEGNKLSGEIDLHATITTLIAHIYGGTALSSFERHGIPTSSDLAKASSIEIFTIVSAFITTFLYSFYATQKLYGTGVRTGYSVTLAFFGALIAILSTLPIAMVKKYQDWCVIHDVCIFHDARISVFGVGLFLMAILLVCNNYVNYRFLSFLSKTFTSLILATIGALTLYTNIGVSKDMRDYVGPWYRAQQIACGFRKAKEDRSLISQLYFNRAVSAHTDFDVEEYWRTYISQFPIGRCSSVPQQLLVKLHPAELSQGIDFSLQSWPSFLTDVGGVSVVEPWGRWSDSSLVPSVYFQFSAPLPKRFDIVADVTVFGPNAQMPMIVRVGDQETQVVLPAAEGIIRIPVENANARSIEFFPPNPTSPEGESSRKIAVGFRRLDFEIKS